jgi:hypothetical protein
VIGEPLADGGAHHAGRDDGDHRMHASFSNFDPADANLLTSDDLGKALFPRTPRRLARAGVSALLRRHP